MTNWRAWFWVGFGVQIGEIIAEHAFGLSSGWGWAIWCVGLAIVVVALWKGRPRKPDLFDEDDPDDR